MTIWIIYISSVILITLFGMLGGQYGPALRKYGILVVTLALIAWRVSTGQVWWHYSAIPLFCTALFLGYGEKSWIMKKLKNEILVRIAYALSISIPLVITALLNTKGILSYILIPSLIVGAFQLRGGGFKIGKKDFLFVDLARWSAVGISVILAV